MSNIGYGTIVDLHSSAWSGGARGVVEHVDKSGRVKVNLKCARAPEILAAIKGTPMAGVACDFEDVEVVDAPDDIGDGVVVAVAVPQK